MNLFEAYGKAQGKQEDEAKKKKKKKTYRDQPKGPPEKREREAQKRAGDFRSVMTEKTEKHPGGAHPGSRADVSCGPGGRGGQGNQHRQGHGQKGYPPVCPCVEYCFRVFCPDFCVDVSGAPGRVN
jgi:hypothetical protein